MPNIDRLKKEFEKIYGISWDGHSLERQQWLKNRTSPKLGAWEGKKEFDKRYAEDRPPSWSTFVHAERSENERKALSFLKSADRPELPAGLRKDAVEKRAHTVCFIMEKFTLGYTETAKVLNLAYGVNFSGPSIRYMVWNARRILKTKPAHASSSIQKSIVRSEGENTKRSPEESQLQHSVHPAA